MSIGWFPGHMTSARRKAAEAMAQVDVVVELLDARIPGASTNPMIAEMRAHRQRPALKILNKADQADPAATAAWMRVLEEEGKRTRGSPVKAVAMSFKKPADVARVTRLAGSLVPHRGGPEKPLRIMVMGIPNVGKSTLINGLVKKRVANVGDEPAVTKLVQRYDLPDRTVLYDTPGLMWPRIAHPSDGLMLAASHAIGPNAYVDEEVATFLANVLRERYPALLAKRYGCDPASEDATSIIESVARTRNFRLKGGEHDFEKAALALLNDYRSGTLGRISLETPASRAQMLARKVPVAKHAADAHADGAEPEAAQPGAEAPLPAAGHGAPQ
jgi:ribosome biogenesis GTPase A